MNVILRIMTEIEQRTSTSWTLDGMNKDGEVVKLKLYDSKHIRRCQKEKTIKAINYSLNNDQEIILGDKTTVCNFEVFKLNEIHT